MKTLFVLMLTIVLFGCKDKSQETAITPNPVPAGLVGTYSKTYTLEEYEVFRFVIPERKIFQQTATVVVTQTATGDYNLAVTLFGIAKRDKEPDIHFGLTAELKQVKGYNIDGSPALIFRGNFDNLIPNSPDFNGNQIYSEIKLNDRSIDFGLQSSYLEDRGTFVSTRVPKIK